MVTNNEPVQMLGNTKTNTNRQEKPRHLKYLNEFRTQQCLLFLEQQCQFHRPYTCFHWHFPNQKRRRPFKRVDGTFNYNPDVYCDKYDETTGSCVDGDDCPYAHRNAGDTERRYHPRYFKTGTCIYETTDTGACVKNGLHCAFAHGPDDLRLPVYDIREIQDSSSRFIVNLPASLEKERVLSEDPKWNEMFHVLACYKTESCKKPPRMCRQGYSCPFYHNGKDKRRAPDKWRYRSTPCPSVRPGDEWLDSGLCESGDHCSYCHTRTEQQFHPEIYKSTKCNDVINSGYCPRGPFCAFAHCDSELTAGKEFYSKLQHDRPLSAASHPYMLTSGATESPLSHGHQSMMSSMFFPMASSQPIGTISSPFLQRTTNHMVPYLTADAKAACLSEASGGAKRSSHLTAGGVLPHLMSANIGTSPCGAACISGRGRRVARGASPHQLWQQQQQADRAAALSGMASQSSFMNAFPGSETFSPTLCQNSAQSAFYKQYHPQDSGGRHRSGSSISSESGLTLGMRDGTPPNWNVAVGTSTYPGRSAGMDATTRFGSPHQQPQGAKSQQPHFIRSTSKKQSTGQNMTTASTNQGVLAQQSLSRTLNLADTTSQTRADLWNQSGANSVDHWSWRMHTDSGNNSETSITDVPSLLDLVPTSSNTSASRKASETSFMERSNRDSGLVLDFSMPGGVGDAFDHHHTGQRDGAGYRPNVQGGQAYDQSTYESSTNEFTRDVFEDMQSFYNRLVSNHSSNLEHGFTANLDETLQSQDGFDADEIALVPKAASSPIGHIANFKHLESQPFARSTHGTAGQPISSAQNVWPFEFKASQPVFSDASNATHGDINSKSTPLVSNQSVHTASANLDAVATFAGSHTETPSPLYANQRLMSTLPLRPTTTNLNFNNVPQSPILISSPFSNPGSELERLSLRRELEEIRQRLDLKEDEVEALRKQRDFVAVHLRDSLDVIYQLFNSLNVSSKDLSKPLFVDTEAGTGSGPSTGGPAFPCSDGSPSMDDMESGIEFTVPTSGSFAAGELQAASEKSQLQRQQEALAALFANPLVAALLKSETSMTTDVPTDLNLLPHESPECEPRTTKSSIPSGSVLYKLQQSDALSVQPTVTSSEATSTGASSPSSRAEHHDDGTASSKPSTD